MSVLFRKIFVGGGQHQLDAVQLVDLAGARIVIHGHDIGLREGLAELLDHAFSHHMVGEAAEGLRADNVGDIAMDQLNHLAGQKPPLAGLVAGRYERLGIIDQRVERRRGIEPLAGSQSLAERLSEALQQPHGGFAQRLSRLAKAQMVRLENAVICAVHEEVQHIRADRLGALGLQQIHDVVVGGGEEFHENLSHDADPRFLHGFIQLYFIEILDDCLYIFL